MTEAYAWRLRDSRGPVVVTVTARQAHRSPTREQAEGFLGGAVDVLDGVPVSPTETCQVLLNPDAARLGHRPNQAASDILHCPVRGNAIVLYGAARWSV